MGANFAIALAKGVAAAVSGNLAAAVERLEAAIRMRHPDVRRIFVEAGTLAASERASAA